MVPLLGRRSARWSIKVSAVASSQCAGGRLDRCRATSRTVGKNDAADAEAICEAVTRPTMRFVAIKTKEQQAVLVMHRARDLLVRQRTQVVNALRGFSQSSVFLNPRAFGT